MFSDEVPFETLVGKTLVSVEGLTEGSEEVLFVTADGERFRMYHSQDCCESVSLVDVDGVEGVTFPCEVTAAECVSFDPPSAAMKDESETWTFYKLQISWHTIVLRWVGSSNGYYSEGVSFEKLRASEPTP